MLIGKKGETKRQIEERTETKITINSNEEIVIEGNADKVFFCRDVVTAIGRGFSPDVAYKILEPDNMFEVIELEDFAHTRNRMRELKGRVIGTKGRIKEEIERSTDSYISVYGSTVSIIAPYYAMRYVKEVLERILRGAKHSSVLSQLARIKKELALQKLRGFRHI